jgi:hypothetical protein
LPVYNDAMGLFHRRVKKNHEKAAAELLKEKSATAKAQTEVAPREAAGEARPDPDRPGWGEAIGQQIGRIREERASQE